MEVQWRVLTNNSRKHDVIANFDVIVSNNYSCFRFALKECAVYAGEYDEDAKPTGLIIDNYCKTPEFNHIVFKDDCK